jgi:hypothetical protein
VKASASAFGLVTNLPVLCIVFTYQVEVKVVCAKVLERCVERLLDVIGVMAVVPELGCDEELLARYTRLLDGVANGRFCAVDARSVDVAVAGFQCHGDSSVLMLPLIVFLKTRCNIRFLSIFVLPCTEANGRNLSSSVELNGGCVVRHSELL